MTKHTLSVLAACTIFLLAAQPGWAQAHPGPWHASQARQDSNQPVIQTSLPTNYTYTLFAYPGTFTTFAIGTNVSGTKAKYEIVGGYGTDSLLPGNSWRAYFSGITSVTEKYQGIAAPNAAQQAAFGVNTPGQIVGQYVDSSNVYHAWELNGTTYSVIDVPFTGATGSIGSGITDTGEIVGGWNDASFVTHGFTLIGGTYTSFDYPGAIGTGPFAINNKGNIVGYYTDSSGTEHAFSLISGTYANIDPPGSVWAYGAGINDSNVIVGTFCTTTSCINNGIGSQGFLLSGGVFTLFNITPSNGAYLGGINNKGVLVGGYTDTSGYDHGFVAVP